MNNLFSVFDPISFLSLPLNWCSSFILLLAIPSLYWARPSTINNSFHTMKNFLNAEFQAIFGNISAPGLSLIPISMLLFIMLNNFLGLLPFMFTSSSHLTFTISLALPLWLGHMMMGWVKTPSHMFAHLVPLGTPPALMPFMVLIESVSSMIRPLTLSVRLAANMVAGHLLLTLLGNQAPNSQFLILSGILFSLILLTILETAVALIQAYVFSILSTLYFNEVNSPTLNF